MIRINLLPHREQKRQAKVRRFGMFLGVFAAAGAAIVAAGFLYFSQRIDVQDERNQYLETVNKELDAQLAEIETLKKERRDLLARKDAVERLQSNRAEAVKIMDQLARQLPEGIYLVEAKQAGTEMNLIGHAQSSARVATFMRALADSPQFESPNLVKIESKTVSNQRVNEFTLKVIVTRVSSVTDETAPSGQVGTKG